MGDEGKRAAAEAAADLVSDGMSLGLGTGSTVAYFLDLLAARRLDVAGVPTSEATAARCRQLGIRLLEPGEAGVELAVDGADEIDGQLDLTKGGGGALLREKVVAHIADVFVVIATLDKAVERLGRTFPVPLEVVPFALRPVSRMLADLGYEAVARQEGRYRTDNGNVIVDVRAPGGIEEPRVAEMTFALIPGVAESGLFVGMADQVILGGGDGDVTVLARPDEAPTWGDDAAWPNGERRHLKG